MNAVKLIQFCLLLIECFFCVFYGYITMKARRSRIESNITITKALRIFSNYSFMLIIAGIAFLILSLVAFSQ